MNESKLMNTQQKTLILVDDLAVSAPLIGAPGNAQFGVVYLILGSKVDRASCKLCGAVPTLGTTTSGL